MHWAVQGVSLPATQTVPNYALLAVVYGVLQLGRREKRQNGFGGYAAVAFLDVEANFLVVSNCHPSICHAMGALTMQLKICWHPIAIYHCMS